MGGAAQAFFGQVDKFSKLMQEGDRTRASAALDEALALLDASPNEEGWHEAVVEPLWRLGRLEEAAEHLEALLETQAKASGQLATAYIRLGRLEQAVKLLKQHPLNSAQYHLQLGTALRYRGHLEEARPELTRAFERANEARDLAAAVSALVAQGELELDAENPKEAVLLFGKALGLTERSSDERLTVLPLAGLAEAQSAWGYPAKGRTLAKRAKERAERQEDKVALARSLLSLGVTTKSAEWILKAVAAADAAPHLPLALRASTALAEAQPGLIKLQEAIKLAERLGMTLELYRLRGLAQRSSLPLLKPPASS